jgi:hypothetical protein
MIMNRRGQTSMPSAKFEHTILACKRSRPTLWPARPQGPANHYSQHFTRKFLRSDAGLGGKFTGGWTTGLLLVENNMTHQGFTLLHTDWKHLAACRECTFTVYCGCCDNIVHWIPQNRWKPIVCCSFTGCGINAFRTASSNSSHAAKSCACAYIAFLAGIFSWYADST